MSENGESYLVVGEAGTLEFVGAAKADEVFSHQDFGTLNITRAWKLIPKGTKPRRVPLTANVVDHLRYRDLDQNVIAKMTPTRMREPVLSVWLPTGAQLIDGAHRLEKRRQKGRDWFETFVLVADAIDECRIRVFQHNEDGSKTEMDTRYAALGFEPTKGWAPGSGR